MARIVRRSTFLLVVLGLALSAYAADPTPAQEKVVRSISGSIFSPYCPGRTLEDCPSGSASELRKKIQDKVVAGESEASIYEYLFNLYGEQLRALPKAEGFGLVAWWGPVLFLVVGVLGVVVWLRRAPPHSGAASAPVLTDREQRRIQAEIER